MLMLIESPIIVHLPLSWQELLGFTVIATAARNALCVCSTLVFCMQTEVVNLNFAQYHHVIA